MVLWIFGPFCEVVMVFLSSKWRCLAGLAVLGGLALAVGCKGSTPAPAPVTTPTYTISGTVKFTRIPLVKDAVTGIPTGLETDSAKFTELPARGIFVRALKSKTETDGSGNSVTVWSVANSAVTSSTGEYKLTVDGEAPTFIEVMSSMQTSTGSPVRLVAADIASTVPIIDRPVYALRKGIDGSSPAGNSTPGTVATANATVDFKVDLDTPWWVTPASANILSQAVRETVGSGSRILGILDSAYTFATAYGDATPGSSLSLHYLMGSSWAHGVRPSFVEFDRTKYPAAFDGSSFHYLGLVRAASGLDDTWNESALFTMFAKNMLYRQHFTQLLPTVALADGTDLQDLFPEMALVEGFAPAMAAILGKSPYLVLNATTPPTLRDIRVRTGLGTDAYSAASVAALSWEVALKAGSLPTPGLPADWAKLEAATSARWFVAALPKDDAGHPKDTINLYNQVARLKEAKGGSEPVDLAAIFTDTVLTPMVAPFGLTWPRPTSGPEVGYLVDWGKDPNSLTTALPSFTLSMASAHRNALGVYPNFSKGEVFQARFLLSKDLKYRLTLQVSGGIPAGAKIEVILGGNTFSFSATETTVPDFWLLGNSTTPVFQIAQVRLLSPDVQQSDLTITLRLDAQN